MKYSKRQDTDTALPITRGAILQAEIADIDPNGRFEATCFSLDALCSLTAEQLDRMSSVGFPERCGCGTLDELVPKNTRYGVSHDGQARVETVVLA